jgi:predicted O-methyltransferase YrrM
MGDHPPAIPKPQHGDAASLPYDLAEAERYIRGLACEPLMLPFGPDQLIGERIQPTIGPAVAALLELIVRSTQPPRILEIGTSFGYSACVLGRSAASYGGRVISLERNVRLAELAQRNVEALDLASCVQIIIGDSTGEVSRLDGQFGLILQDGGKDDYEPLLPQLIERVPARGSLVSDDVLFPVMSLPPQVAHWQEAMDRYNRALAAHPALRTIWLPIGDGVAWSVKIA